MAALARRLRAARPARHDPPAAVGVLSKWHLVSSPRHQHQSDPESLYQRHMQGNNVTETIFHGDNFRAIAGDAQLKLRINDRMLMTSPGATA